MEGYNIASEDKRTSGDTERAEIWGDSLGAVSRIKLSPGAFRGNPPVSLVLPVSLLVGFPDFAKYLLCQLVWQMSFTPKKNTHTHTHTQSLYIYIYVCIYIYMIYIYIYVYI